MSNDSARRLPVDGGAMVRFEFKDQLVDDAKAFAKIEIGGDLSLTNAQGFVWPNGREAPHYNVIHQQATLTNWGASGGFIETVVEVSAELGLDVLAGILTTYIVEGLRTGRVQQLPPDESGADARARQFVLARHTTETAAGLDSVGYATDADGTEIVSLQSPTRDYRVRVRRLPGNHSFVAMSWSAR